MSATTSPKTKRYCLTLDLHDDPALIAEYKRYHEQVWPEITSTFKPSGIECMEIYLLASRLFMVIEVNDTFSFEAKAKADRENPKVQQWENLMWKFQKPLPGSHPGEKWLQMDRIFKFPI
ncbi:MAG TPA: L-rhamnose mutarotase [Candidatus Acidoferrum sp.]|nr:L-rhamnose mutarotase [Candidatus Acidoferrum sp.]